MKVSIISGGRIKKVDAEPVTVADIKCHIREEFPFGWILTHGETGWVVSESQSKRDCIAKARKRIRELGRNAEQKIFDALLGAQVEYVKLVKARLRKAAA